MYDQLINSETAKLASENGFNEGSYYLYVYPNNVLTKFGAVNYNSEQDGLQFEAPTQSLLQKWIREKHKIHIEIGCNGDEHYVNSISYPEGDDYVYDQDLDTIGFKTYEEALELGLQESLKLI